MKKILLYSFISLLVFNSCRQGINKKSENKDIIALINDSIKIYSDDIDKLIEVQLYQVLSDIYEYRIIALQNYIEDKIGDIAQSCVGFEYFNDIWPGNQQAVNQVYDPIVCQDVCFQEDPVSIEVKYSVLPGKIYIFTTHTF